MYYSEMKPQAQKVFVSLVAGDLNAEEPRVKQWLEHRDLDCLEFLKAREEKRCKFLEQIQSL